MKENSAVKSRVLFPLQLAEGANRGFVKAVQYIFGVINYDFHTTRSEGTGTFRRDATSSRDRYQYIPSKPRINPSVAAPVSHSVSVDGNNAQSSQEIDPTETITLLFSDFAEDRLYAIRWISDHKYSDALPMLESILLIEDNNEVYEEVCKLINLLRETDIEIPDRE